MRGLDGIGLTAIDLSVSQGGCPSNLALSMAGTLLPSKEQAKRDKYMVDCAAHGISLRPFALESSGRLGPSAFNTVKQIVTKGLEYERDASAASVHQIKHFLQRLSCTMRSHNARMILHCAGRSRFYNGLRRNEDPFDPLVPNSQSTLIVG